VQRLVSVRDIGSNQDGISTVAASLVGPEAEKWQAPDIDNSRKREPPTSWALNSSQREVSCSNYQTPQKCKPKLVEPPGERNGRGHAETQYRQGPTSWAAHPPARALEHVVHHANVALQARAFRASPASAC
jgi:hypothetical protein